MTNIRKIEDDFEDEDIENKLGNISDRNFCKVERPKHMILPHEGFERVQLPSGEMAKIAYNNFYSVDTEDLEIELEHIRKNEPLVYNSNKKKKAIEALKYHYKRCVAIISPKMAAGWHRWNENILELFLSDKIFKVVWGSGNCGKSATCALLLYIKWRVIPTKRSIVIASKVMTDSKARVIAYMKEIHLNAPKSTVYRFKIDDSKETIAIYSMIFNKDSGRWVKNDRGCIKGVAIKVDSKNDELGSNLLGHHPDDRLILAFDEAQELPGKLLRERVVANWLTNQKLDIYAWGNPMPVDWNDRDNWDMLFDLGQCKYSLQTLRKKEKEATKTSTWENDTTKVLHITMTDSPKDDEDEKYYHVDLGAGVKDVRLHFLAGKKELAQIAQNIPTNSSTWYSQVLGFPFINAAVNHNPGVLTPMIVKESKRHELIWYTPENELSWFMGVDPSLSDKGDNCCIVVGRMGMMRDGRMGVDLMGGKYCRTIASVSGEEFMDTTVNEMHELSVNCGIPLKNIAIDAHGVGDVLRYALEAHIEKGKWGADRSAGQTYFLVNPMIKPSDRYLFKTIGKMVPAAEMVTDCITEYWTAVRCMFLSKQIFNVPDAIIKQFYNRYLLKASGGVKYKIETKDAMKKRGVRSPGEADALCNLVELVRSRGFAYKFYMGGRYNSSATDMIGIKDAQRKREQGFSIVERLLQINMNLGSNAGYVGGGNVGSNMDRGKKWYDFDEV